MAGFGVRLDDHPPTVTKEPLHLPGVPPGRAFLLRGVLSLEECSRIISAADARGFESLSGVFHQSYRDNQRVVVFDQPLADQLYHRCSRLLPQANLERTHQAAGLNECFRACKYEPGGHFAPHVDGEFDRHGDGRERSYLTFMVYLNGQLDGGATNFICRVEGQRIKVPVPPETGMALVFPHELVHEGAVLQSGRKFILRTEVMYKGGVSEVEPVIARIANQYEVSVEEAAAMALPLLRAHGREVLDYAELVVPPALRTEQGTRSGHCGGFCERDTESVKRPREANAPRGDDKPTKKHTRCFNCKRFNCFCVD